MAASGGFPETRVSLVARLRDAGDSEAWSDFVSLYRPVIYRLARQRGLQDADAQDLSQRVLTAVSKVVAKWEPDESRAQFRTWLSRIVQNAIVNAATRRKPDRGWGGTSVWDLLEDQPEEDSTSQAEFDYETRREVFRRASTLVRRTVSSEMWEMFAQSTFGGLSVEETARRLGKSNGAVYAARSRVMKRLRDAVREFDDEHQCASEVRGRVRERLET